jgi:hypothetical protein
MMLMILGEPLTDLWRGLHSVVATSYKVKVLACPAGEIVLIPDLVDDVGVWENQEVLLTIIASKISPSDYNLMLL